MNSYKKAAFRNDAVAKVTGQAKFASDMVVPDMLHGVPVYTDFVHAKIINIEIDDALKQPGVKAIITAKDVAGTPTFGQILKDYHMFAEDKIRCNGDVIALVVADTRKRAIEASKLVLCEATPLKVLSDPMVAMEDKSNLVHEAHGSNIVNHHKIRRGDIDKGFAESDIIIEKDFSTQRVEHAYLETEATLCVPRQDGVMEVYASTQHPFSARRFVAALLGIKLADVEVKTVPMGGGFGGKDDTAAIVSARAALAASILKKPVKVHYDREWSIRESYKRHPYRVKYKWGLTKDGIIKAAKVHTIADAGSYCSVTPWVTWRSTVQCCGPYCVENVHCDTYGVYTNNVYTGAFRGFGAPQLNFIVEQMIEIAALKLNIPAIELRRKNMVKQGSTTITGQVLNNHTVSLDEVLTAILERSDYENKLTKCCRGQGDGDELYGIGLALSYRGMSLGGEGMDFNAAIINVQFDGSILLEVAVHENGQGLESAMILLLAQLLGVSRERIRYRQPSTSNIPDGGTTVASRGTLVGCGALCDAVTKLKGIINPVVAPKLGCQPDDIGYRDDRLWNEKDNRSMSFDDAMHELFLNRVYPYSFGVFIGPRVSWNEKIGSGDAYFTWVYGCQVIELTVNKKTGKVTLLGAWAAHDVGKAINPPMLLGQYYGGITQGIGYALFEEIDSEEGKIANQNFDGYHIPRAKDLPEMHGIIVENFDPNCPSGAKGIGEPALEIAAPAIANAIYNATGKRYYSLPLKIKGGGI